MLFLPAFRFEDLEIRLPSPANAVFDLCTTWSERDNSARDLQVLLSQSPSLLIYSLFLHWQSANRAATSWAELAGFLNNGYFKSNIESRAFEVAPEWSDRQWRRAKRWLAKPTTKRLQRFLTSVTHLDAVVASRFLTTIVDSRFSPVAVVGSQSGHLSSKEPKSQRRLRSIWMMCAELHQLKTDFDTELHSRKLQAMKQLAYGASHEINNPLANIATRAQSLMTEEANPSRRQRLSVIYAQAMRAHEMISDMMLFAHPPAIFPEPVEPRALVSTVIDELKQLHFDSGFAVRIHQYPDVPVVELDRTQFAVAIKSLLDNAIHAIGTAGEIRIQIWRNSEQEWSISVADDGPGIGPDIADQIFDPFFSGREAGRGLGFGLSKVWRIIRLHGGRIELDRQYSKGARFVATLPIVQSDSAILSCNGIDIVRAA